MKIPSEIAKTYMEVGAKKTKLPPLKIFILAIFAGMFIAIGAFSSSVASCTITTPAVARLTSSMVFPIGLMMVLVAGGELFTGNSLILLPVLQKKAKISKMLLNWLLVYLGNFVGSLFIAWAINACGSINMYNGGIIAQSIQGAEMKINLTFLQAFLRGILCNIMVCIAVWVSFAADDLAGKIIALYLPVFLFVLSGWEHCVANMYFIPVAMIAAKTHGISTALTLKGFLINNLVPVTLGNIIGGAIFVGTGYWLVFLKGHRE